MNYHDTRDWFSDYLDEALSLAERAEADAHLAACGECRRELERFRQTVSLLHQVERPRAPVGFVDRVVTAAAPRPWYRRWPARLFPIPVTLSAQVAALVVLSIGAVYLFQRSPELQQTAREAQPPASRQEPPASPPPASTMDGLRDKSAEQPPQAERESGKPRPDRQVAKAKPPLPTSTPLMTPGESSAGAPSVQAEAKKEGALDQAAAQRSADVRARTAPAAPAVPERRDSNERLQSAPPAPATGAVSKSAAITNLVAGRLAVKDRDAAERALSQLLSRVKATELSRRRDPSGVVLEVLVPKDAYPELTEGLARIGAWTLEAEPAELPAQVPMRLRLLE